MCASMIPDPYGGQIRWGLVPRSETVARWRSWDYNTIVVYLFIFFTRLGGQFGHETAKVLAVHR